MQNTYYLKGVRSVRAAFFTIHHVDVNNKGLIPHLFCISQNNLIPHK